MSTKSSSSTGGTVTALRGGRVVRAKTDQTTWRVDARGQVGTDARLQSVASDVRLTMKEFQRGHQMEMTLTAAVTQTRDGAPRVSGTPRVDMRIRSAALSPAQERAAEAEWAGGMASSPEIARAIGKLADTARWRLLESEYVWYQLPNYCAQIAWTPGAGALVEPGETKRVTGHVVAKRDGGVASGAIELGAVSRGRLIPITKAFAPGSPASFIAAGAEPDSERTTVDASAIATSTAGRAQQGWFARGTPVRLPRSFQGSVSSTATGGGLTREFSGSATYTRTTVARGPDGSLNAWSTTTSRSPRCSRRPTARRTAATRGTARSRPRSTAAAPARSSRSCARRARTSGSSRTE